MSDRLKPLLDAINGLPDEPRAVRTIATYALMPTTCAGIVGGALAVPHTAGFWVLVGAAAGGAAGGAALTVAAVLLTHRLFGFRAVVRVGEAVLGLFGGFFLGVALTWLFDLGSWPLLLAPAGAVLSVIFRPFTRRPKAYPPADPLKPGEWRRKTWD